MNFNLKAPIILIRDRFFKKYPTQSNIPKDSGKIILKNNKKVAVYKNKSGKEYHLSPYCTHLGCVIDWNKEKKEWHCPCHGSVFSKTGEVKKGPAKKQLKNLKDEKQYSVKILKIKNLAHNVKEFTTEKPKQYSFRPGQATNIAFKKDGEFRPFTFTSTNKEKNLKFIIKQYPSHNGFTKELHKKKENQNILITQPFGNIRYKGDGIFLSAGTGINPFLAILRDLKENGEDIKSKVVLSNKKKRDIYLEKELCEILGKENLTITLTKENLPEYRFGRIDRDLIEEKLKSKKQYIYICGPESFEKDMSNILSDLKIKKDMIVKEAW